jgi:hypothetical protein
MPARLHVMTANDPRDHHVVPQFFLRNFAVDDARMKVTTVAREGRMAVWMERSIKGLGYERDFYVHIARGRPVSVETAINRSIETPISQSDTWAKIVAGRSDALDRSDRPILYALVRHLETRTPHYLETGRQLTEMAAAPHSAIPFTDEEREMYAFHRANPEFAKATFNFMATNPFDEREYDSSLIVVARSPIPLRTSTTPAIAAKSPAHPAMDMPLPGMVPFQRILTVDPHTMVAVTVGDFGGHFENIEMDVETAIGINRTFAGHFGHFPHVRHLVTGRDRLIEDMAWAPYDLVSDSPGKVVFRRRDGN